MAGILEVLTLYNVLKAHSTGGYIFQFDQNEDKVDFTSDYIGFYLILHLHALLHGKGTNHNHNHLFSIPKIHQS